MGKANIDKRGRSIRTDKYVRIFHRMLKTPAWRSLDCVARAAYIELSMRYNGRNNGEIRFSLREMGEKLDVSKATAMRAMNRLQDRGFIVKTKAGAFNMGPGNRTTSLTEKSVPPTMDRETPRIAPIALAVFVAGTTPLSNVLQ